MTRMSRRWIKTQECTEGDSSSSLSSSLEMSPLEKEYPSCVRLFRNLLEKKYGELEELVVESGSIDPSSSNQTAFLQLLMKLSKAMRTLSEWRDYKLLEMLRDRKIFPVSTPPETTFHCMSASDVQSLWFIADDPDLFQKFRGRIPMLALPPEKVKLILNLLQELHLESRLLSKAVKHDFAPRGRPYLHEEYTNRLSSKAKLIKR